MENNSWLLKCSSSTLQPSTSQEAQDQKSGCYFYAHAGQDLRGQVHGRRMNTTLPNTAILSSCNSSQVDLDSSFLAFLSGPASLVHSEFQEFVNSKPFNSSIKLPVEIGSVAASPTGSENPLAYSRQPTENRSYQDMQSGVNPFPTILPWAAASVNYSSSSVFQNGLPSVDIGLNGSSLAKTVIHDVASGNNDKSKDFHSLRGEWRIPSLANAVKLQNVNSQMSQNLPLESEFSASCISSGFPSSCPRVFCMDRSGDLLLSNSGHLGILCSCHCFHMSVSKFSEHSGLWNVNPGDCIRMESGETIAQWRKLYFQKFGIRVPEDQSGWDWPEGLPLTASLMRSGVSMFNMSKNYDSVNFGVSEALARSGRSLSDVPKSMLTDQISVIDALHDKQKGNVQESHKIHLKGLVDSSPSNSCAVEDNHVMDCSISRWLTILNPAGRGPESVRESMHVDHILKSGSLSNALPTLQNLKTIVENSDIGRGKEAQNDANVDREASFSSIELKLGQPYQQSKSSGNSVLPLIGPQFYSPLVNSQKSFSQEQLIHNATNCQREDESRQCLPLSAVRSNPTARWEQDHLRYGSNQAVDATELEKLDFPSTSVVSVFQNYSLPEGSQNLKAVNNIHNNHLYVMTERRNCESHAFKFEPNNFPWIGGKGLDRQCHVPESGFLKHAENGKEVGCPFSSTYIEKHSHSKMQKSTENATENARSYGLVVHGSTYSTFPSMHEKSRYPHCLPNLPPDVCDAANFMNHLEKVPCFGSGGSTDLAFFRSMGSSLVSPPSASKHIPGPTLSMPNHESICAGSHLFDDNLRLLALRQLQDLSKQHAIASGKNAEQGNCINCSNVEVQHTFVAPSLFKEQRHLANIPGKLEEVVMKSDKSVPISTMVNDLDKSTCMTGLNRSCNQSTWTQDTLIQCKDFGLQSQLTSFQDEHTSLRLGRCENIIRPNEDGNCYQRMVYSQQNCNCTAHAKCIGEKCRLRGQKDTNFLRGQNGSMSCKTPTLNSSDSRVLEVNTVSSDQYGMLKGKPPKNITCYMSLCKDVSGTIEKANDVDCGKRSTVASDRREHELGQLEDAAAKCFDGAVLTTDSFKEQDVSNISSGCSTPVVTQVSIKVTNVDSSTVVRNEGCVNDDVVDEGSGIDKCCSSDDAVNKSSRTLLDEVKLMDSLTWKKVRNKKHHGIPVYRKINWSEESDRGLKTGERNVEMNLHQLNALSGTANSVLYGKYPWHDQSANLSCVSNNVQLVSSGPDSTWTSGIHRVKTNPKPKSSTLSFTRTASRKRDLQRLYHSGGRDDDPNSERKNGGNSCKILEISGRKKLRTTRNAFLCMQLQRQESSHGGGKKAVKYNLLNCTKVFSTQQVNPCYKKAKPVVCGKYGEIINRNLTGDMSQPVKIVSLDKVLKTASRCSLPKNCIPGLTSSMEMGINFSGSNACFDKLSNLIKEKKPMSNNALASEGTDSPTYLDEGKISSTNDDEQSADELSLLEKSEDISEKGCRIPYANAPNHSKLRYKKTRKRSLYELTFKGNKLGPEMFPQKNIFKDMRKIRWRKIMKNSDRSHVIGSQKFDPERCAIEHTCDLFCCVCRSSNKDEANCLLECGGCSIRVHQACYGVPKVPKGQWYCRPCRTNSKNIVCVLCGYGGGAMTLALQSRTIVKGLLKAWNPGTQCSAKKSISYTENLHDEVSMLHGSGTAPENGSYPVLRAVNAEPSTSTVCNMDVQNQLNVLSNFKLNNSITAGVLDPTVKQWVHMVCGLWTPGTRCPNVNTMSAFDVSGASRPSANVICSLCNRPGGTCIQCRVANCHIKFHPWCAYQKGLLQNEAEGVDNENVGFYGRCELHVAYTNGSACDAAVLDVGDPAEKEVSCARTEGYKGRKRDGFWHNMNNPSTGKGGFVVPQEQFDAWVHINGLKSCAQEILKLPMSEKEHDCRKEYTRYKQGRGWKHLVVYKSGIHALGLYTSQFISRGEMVVEYVGEIVGLRVADKRENEYQSGRKLQYKSACYFFKIDKEHIIDATHQGGIARFVNHSCLPNCVAKIISVRNEKKVVFLAERDIYPGEEITYDYHFNHEDEGKKIPCFCNSKNCRRYLN